LSFNGTVLYKDPNTWNVGNTNYLHTSNSIATLQRKLVSYPCNKQHGSSLVLSIRLFSSHLNGRHPKPYTKWWIYIKKDINYGKLMLNELSNNLSNSNPNLFWVVHHWCFVMDYKQGSFVLCFAKQNMSITARHEPLSRTTGVWLGWFCPNSLLSLCCKIHTTRFFWLYNKIAVT
jgi:hypothetical protein